MQGHHLVQDGVREERYKNCNGEIMLSALSTASNIFLSGSGPAHR